MTKNILSFVPQVLAIFVTFIFVDSLRYKFTNHEKTEHIFGILNDWAGSWGASGLFSHSGIFSQYMIGSFEGLASLLLVLGILPQFRRWQGVGAAIACVIITGALYFHLFTPLGTDPNNDGGGLFVVAVLVWLSSIVLVVVRWKSLKALISRA